MKSLPPPALARAGSGVCYGYYEHAGDVLPSGRVVEFAPQQIRETAELWPAPSSDFAMMKKVKHMFDPESLLNRGRLYGRI
jgi:glycolate oxidase FAD binding subunit